MADTIWVPIAVAVVTASASTGLQLLLNRGEPAALKKLKALGEVIDSMPQNDAGRENLVAARSHLASRLARSLIGVQGYQKYVRRTSWALLALGAIVLAGWAIVGIADPDLWRNDAHNNWGVLGLLLVLLAPTLLTYAAIFPAYEAILLRLFQLWRRQRQEKAARQRQVDAADASE